MGLNFTEEDHVNYFIGASLNEGTENYLKSLNKLEVSDEFITSKKSYDKEYKSIIEPIPGSLECVKNLKSKYKLAICSGARSVLVDPYIEKFNLQNTFATIVTSDDVSKSKPDPESYIKTLQQLDISNTDAIAIEDSISGIRSATSAGIYTIAITTTHTKEEIKEANLVVNDFTSLGEIAAKFFE